MKLLPKELCEPIDDAQTGAPEATADFLKGEYFDARILCAQEGILKPDAEMYRRRMGQVEVAPEEAIPWMIGL